MDERLKSRHVVLLGIGHTNAHIVRMWGMNPLADTDLTCISEFSVSTYSGFLPAVLAGQKAEAEMQIDLPPLCAAAGARLITDPVVGLDHDRNEVLFANRSPVKFDVMSIGIGSVPSSSGTRVDTDTLVMIKPMPTLLWRLGNAVQKVKRSALKVAVVGGGVAGAEVTLCLRPYLKLVGCESIELMLITGSQEIVPDLTAATRNRVVGELKRRDVQLVTGRRVNSVVQRTLTLDDGSQREAEIVIWATGATAPPLLSKLGLPTDDRGFLATDVTLRSTSQRPIFAVGDSGTMIDQPVPKAGVFAVRQGPVLWQNIQRSLAGKPLEPYRPQRTFMKLINKGDGTAIGQWKGWSFEGKWVMWLKDSIDSRFMAKYRPQPMMSADEPMQCRGCGCKLGAGDLQSALSSHDDIEFEDAAPIADSNLVASTDFFTSPLTDPYLSGRVAALHCASDIICSGADPTTALANVVLPEGEPESQRTTLSELLAGARREFDAMGAKLVGGHTIVGPRMEIGFTVIGKPIGDHLIRKSNLQVGDQLFLTKSLGIGIVLAAHNRGMASAAAYDCMLDHMLDRQHEIIRVAIDCGVTAGTDVTGFGLAGHLIEMLQASDVSAKINLNGMPLLIGTHDYIQAGIASSLAPANRRFESQLEASPEVRGSWIYQTLFDPQTSGGLLLGVPPEQADRFGQGVSELELPPPCRIGEVISSNKGPRLHVVQE